MRSRDECEMSKENSFEKGKKETERDSNKERK